MGTKVKCASGVTGSRDRLHSIYESLDEYRSYCEFYGLHTRAGYETPEAAWEDNPLIEWSVIPSDYRRVSC